MGKGVEDVTRSSDDEVIIYVDVEKEGALLILYFYEAQ